LNIQATAPFEKELRIKLGIQQQHITHETLEKTRKINFAIFASFRGQL